MSRFGSLAERLKQRERELALLLRLDRIRDQTLDIKQFVTQAASALIEAVDAHLCIVGLVQAEAQYVVPLAYNIRWYMTFNAREAYHMLELRSAMQGHPDYRKVAQLMFKEIEKVHPQLASGMKFMDMKEYKLERLEAEKKLDKKMEEISKKYGS